MRDDGKGAYRSVYCAIWDDPEFQSFDPMMIAVFFSLRTCRECNFPCIYVFYRSVLYDRFPDIEKDVIDDAFDRLVKVGWIEYQRPVLWIVKGLRNEPNYYPTNPKHVQGIINLLQTLPKIEIVNKFRQYYGLPSPNDFRSDTGIGGVSIPVSDQGKGEGKGKGKGKGNGEIVIEKLVPSLRPNPTITQAVAMMSDEQYDQWVRFAYNLILDHPKVEEWKKSFPKVDVFHELNLASDWLLTNPQKRRSHAFQFYGNWIRNAATPRDRRRTT